MKLITFGSITVLLAALSLAGCNNSGDKPVTPITQPTPAPVPSPQPPIGPTPEPLPVPPPSVEPKPEFKDLKANWSTVVFEELWTTTRIGGWFRDIPGPECNNPDMLSAMDFPEFISQQFDWAPIGISSLSGHGKLENNTLVVDSVQTVHGWAMISSKYMDNKIPLRLETTVELLNDPNAWIGICLIQSHGHYREISLKWENGSLVVQRYSPCSFENIKSIPEGQHHLALEWFPEHGWRWLLNNEVILTEDLSDRSSALTNNTHVGIFCVNLGAEASKIEGKVRATVQPVIVKTI